MEPILGDVTLLAYCASVKGRTLFLSMAGNRREQRS